jgi:hypothetical protein
MKVLRESSHIDSLVKDVLYCLFVHSESDSLISHFLICNAKEITVTYHSLITFLLLSSLAVTSTSHLLNLSLYLSSL